MLRSLAAALILVLCSNLPLALAVRGEPVAGLFQKVTPTPPPDPAVVSKWMGKAIEQFLTDDEAPPAIVPEH